MKFEDIKTVSVFGAGLMGNGIAQVMALQGYKVFMRDMSQELVEAGLESVKKSLQKATEREIIKEEQAKSALALITLTANVEEAAKAADFVVEAIPEKMDLKKEFFKQINGICKEETIFATNTSTLSITEIAAATNRPERFIGTHFFNPVPQMKLVEIIGGLLTSNETIETSKKLMVKIGKEPIIIKDAPGFAVNRLLFAIYHEASRMLETGIASPEDIDKGARLGLGHRMGPFETLDLVGLDARLNNLNAMYEMTGDPAMKPPELLKKLVISGYVGRKRGSKGGYYTYFGLE
ncbi:3-hydroxyacyl-CoA dehydrogenase family protein [Chloroflexota bacterium]